MLRFICKLFLAADGAHSQLVELIESDPSAWTYDSCEAKHKSGVHVWIGNGCSFVSVYTDANGYTSSGRKWKPCYAEKILIWKALQTGINRAAARQSKAVNAEILEAIAKANA